MNDVKWTAKGPALIASIVLLIAELFTMRSKWRYAIMAGLVMLAAAGGFLWWSLSIKEWCAARDVQNSAFSASFGGSFHQCLRQKGWMEF